MELLKWLVIGFAVFGVVWLVVMSKRQVWQNIKLQVENCSNKTICIGIVLFMAVTQVGCIFYRKLPISADEIYSMSNAFFLAGYDWSDYMQYHGFYNFGYTMLMMPLCKLFTDAVSIYRAMLFCNIIVQILIVLVVYYIANHYLKCSKCHSIAFALTAGFNALVLFFRGFIYNEIPLTLNVWVVVLLLLALSESKGKQRVILSMLLGAVCAYAYIIHSRCVVIYGALILVAALFLMIYRNWLVQPAAFLPVFGVLLFLEKKMIDYMQVNLYLLGNGEKPTNSVGHVVTGTWRFRCFTSLDGLKDLVAEFFTLSGAASLETGGMLTIATVAALYYIVKKWKALWKGEEDKKKFILCLFSLISLWGMVFMIAMTGAANGKFRFIAYTRYFVPFIGPFLLFGIFVMLRNRELKLKWVAMWSILLTGIVCAVYGMYALPKMYGKPMREITSYYFFMPFVRYAKQLKFTKNVFIIAFGVLAIMTIGLLFLYWRKQLVSFSVAVVLFSVILCYHVEIKQSQPSSERRYMMSDATYELIKNNDLEEYDMLCTGTAVYEKSVLVSCYDEDIIFSQDQEVGEQTVILTNTPAEIMVYQPEYVYQLDGNEWIAGWSEKLEDLLKTKYEPYVAVE